MYEYTVTGKHYSEVYQRWVLLAISKTGEQFHVMTKQEPDYEVGEEFTVGTEFWNYIESLNEIS